MSWITWTGNWFDGSSKILKCESSKVEKPKTVKPRSVRVSEHYARGFKLAMDGQPASALNHARDVSDWQREEIRKGHRAFTAGRGKKRHVQFWLVEGPMPADQVAGEIC